MKLDEPIKGMRPALLAATAAAFALSVVGAFAQGTLASVAAGAAIAVIVAVPLLRVVALGSHWWRIGDHRFAAAAAGVLTVVGAGALIAML